MDISIQICIHIKGGNSMQKKIKKSFAVILSLLMIVTMLPMAVLPARAADTPVPYDGVPVEPLKISQSNYKKLGLTDNNWSQFKDYYAIRDAKELYGRIKDKYPFSKLNKITANHKLTQHNT